MKDEIIRYIRENRVSTTEVADCMGKTGLLEGAEILNRGKFKVGRIHWVYAYDDSNWSIHEQIQNVSRGDIVMIEAFHCGERATIGELVAKYLILYCGAEAIISNEKMRDGARLIKEKYPIWCAGLTPVGCYNKPVNIPADDIWISTHKEIYDGSIAVCDDSGVVIIPKELHTLEFLNKIHTIEEQEDIWFDCLDRRKWNTFDIVCKKRYLKQ